MDNIFEGMDFGPLKEYLDNDDITDISYDNGGQIWIRSLTQGSLRVEVQELIHMKLNMVSVISALTTTQVSP